MNVAHAFQFTYHAAVCRCARYDSLDCNGSQSLMQDVLIESLPVHRPGTVVQPFPSEIKLFQFNPNSIQIIFMKIRSIVGAC